MEGADAAAATVAPRRPVVLYPSPGMGHLVSMIELGKILGARGLDVTIVVTDPPYNTGATGPFLAGVTAANPSISFHRLPKVGRLEPVATKHHEALAFEVIRVSNLPLREFLVGANPAVLIVDFFCCIALSMARELGVPSYFFFTSGAEVFAFFLHLPLVHVPGIPPFPATHAVLPLMECEDAAYHGFLKISAELCSTQGVIINTFRWLEQCAVEAVAAGRCTPPGLPTPPLYCIGPLIKTEEVTGSGAEECLAWLDTHPNASVVFLSFGSIGRFSAEQIREVASGLEASGQQFLWVVRAPPSDDPVKKFKKPPGPDLDALLPEEFLARTKGETDRVTKGRGLVVKSWAPQRDVLAHPSEGGFATHYGWNSVLEAVMEGVPMLAWPLYAEQRLNRVFLEKELQLAVTIEGYDNDKELVGAEEVAAKVRWLLDSDGGRVLRARTLEAMRRARDALREGGESEATLAGLLDNWRRASSSS
ncbi:hypothetical protein PVAP13_8KG135700 [Panicum virgatum]|uniref:Glycosyltransferase n=1 Tax=Panicum virgatum TaxID=38727 RepID=A0A8T0PK70_PANVG|nr:hypothetical protein PVAP13_8KG135700 [Panicum virgatum]